MPGTQPYDEPPPTEEVEVHIVGSDNSDQVEHRHGVGRRAEDVRSRPHQVIVNPPVESGSMGLKGQLWKNMANTSALVLFGVVFIWQTSDSRDRDRANTERQVRQESQADQRERDNRTMFTEQLKEHRAMSQTHADRVTKEITSEMHGMTVEMKRACDALERSEKTLRRATLPEAGGGE